MKTLGILFLTMATTVASAESIFAFKDVTGFDKCLSTEYIVNESGTVHGKEYRALTKIEIQENCIQKAAENLKAAPAKTVFDYVKLAKRRAGFPSSLPLVVLAVQKDKKLCNDMAVYEVFLKTMSYPIKPEDPDSLIGLLKQAVATCLKDAEFKKDFLEEKDNGDSYIKANACELLRENQLVKDCPKS